MLSDTTAVPILSSIKLVKFHPFSTIIGEIGLFVYVIYSPACLHCGQPRPAGVLLAHRNRQTSATVMIQRWGLARLMAEKMANTMVLASRIYLEYFRRREKIIFFARHDLTKYSCIMRGKCCCDMRIVCHLVIASSHTDTMT